MEWNVDRALRVMFYSPHRLSVYLYIWPAVRQIPFSQKRMEIIIAWK